MRAKDLCAHAYRLLLNTTEAGLTLDGAAIQGERKPCRVRMAVLLRWIRFARGWVCSSVGQSTVLIRRGSLVRAQPDPPSSIE